MMGFKRPWTQTLCSVLMVLLSLPSQAHTCPTGCECTYLDANCRDVPAGDLRFPESLTVIKIQKSSDLRFDSKTFGKNLRYVEIDDSHVATVGPGAFYYSKSLVSVKFTSTSIRAINSYAFVGLDTALSIRFQDSMIRSIDPRAFSDLGNVIELTFNRCVVENLQYYAIYNVKAEVISFMDSELKIIHNSAFSYISAANKFQLLNVTSKTIHKNAFSALQESSIAEVIIKQCKFDDIWCSAILGLRNATPESHEEHFSFTDSSLECSCRTVDLLLSMREYKAASNSVVCSQSTIGVFKGFPAIEVIVDNLCPVKPNFTEVCSTEKLDIPPCPSFLKQCPPDRAGPVDQSAGESTQTPVTTTGNGCTTDATVATLFVNLVFALVAVRFLI